MRVFIRTVASSVSQAGQQLVGNKLRTALSLLGVSIGIFCIVAVQAAVDGLQGSVVASLNQLGDKTFYVQKWPWSFGPDYPWWEYVKRPQPTYDEYARVAEDAGDIAVVSLFADSGDQTVKWRSNAVEGVNALIAAPDLDRIFNLEFSDGRFFTPLEFARGADVAVLGAVTAEELFGGVDPVGKEVQLLGRRVTVIGVIEKAGEAMFQVLNFDNEVVVPYLFAAKVLNLDSDTYGKSIAVAPRAGVDPQDLKDAVTVAMRSERRMRPTTEIDFAINNVSAATSFLDQVFGTLNLVGWAIGIFSIFVGGFSVANIMFVSVQERTNLIGVKKALGAARSVILLEFLIESVTLCVVGGVAGIALVALAVVGANAAFPTLGMSVTAGHVAFGVSLAAVIGVLAGVFPAYLAARMDPVEAIRA